MAEICPVSYKCTRLSVCVSVCQAAALLLLPCRAHCSPGLAVDKAAPGGLGPAGALRRPRPKPWLLPQGPDGSLAPLPAARPRCSPPSPLSVPPHAPPVGSRPGPTASRPDEISRDQPRVMRLRGEPAQGEGAWPPPRRLTGPPPSCFSAAGRALCSGRTPPPPSRLPPAGPEAERPPGGGGGGRGADRYGE